MSKLPEGIVTRNEIIFLFFFRTGDGNDPNSIGLFGYPDWYLDNAPSNISLLVKTIFYFIDLSGL